MDLTGHLLLAMPGMGDPRFEHAVVFMAQHSDKGAMGLMVNKPAPDLRLTDVLEKVAQGDTPPQHDLGVHIGGPVETGRGFVLHSDEYASPIETLKVRPGFAMTATVDILEDIAAHKGPENALLMLGYAGWGPGQLEQEIAQNAWLVAPARAVVVFDTADGEKWSAGLNILGVDPLGLSATAGRA